MTPDINQKLAREISCDQYGSSMGRRDQIEGQPERLLLQPVSMVDRAYDRGGAYWGMGTGLWCAFSPEETANEFPVRVFVRGRTRTEAKAAVLALLPGTGWSFYR